MRVRVRGKAPWRLVDESQTITPHRAPHLAIALLGARCRLLAKALLPLTTIRIRKPSEASVESGFQWRRAGAQSTVSLVKGGTHP